jgi:small subunit ribosomal protein S17
MNTITTIKRRLQGTVVGDKMDKTIVVTVRRVATHQKYQKQYAVHKKYKVHDPKNEYHVGDVVIFEAARPISRDKRWRVIGRVVAKQQEVAI